MMEEIMEFKTYAEFEQQVSAELSRQAESFVRLGYLMKIARDTNILAESGYTNVTEFAADKYNLTKDQVSRFININDKFSKGGYSEELEDQFKGYGYSKLSIMLTLPEAVVNVLDPQMTRNQIVEVQKEYKEEKEISPLEAMMEKKDTVQQELSNTLEVFFHRYGHNNREMFERLADARVKAGDFAENVMDVIAPTGIAQLTERIMGVGKLLLSIKGKDEQIQVVNMREDTTEKFQWSDLCNALILYGDGSRETWEKLYGEPYEVAEGILEKEKVNDEERDDSRDNKPGEGKEDIHTKDDTKTEKKSEQTEQDAGQISGRGVEEPQILKIKAVTEELKDKLFKKWFEHVSTEKIELACKTMTHMKFTELINVTPRKLFLLVQTSQVSTEEIVENSQVYTRVSSNDCEGEFSSQDFQKRFNREYLEPYKKRIQELEEKKEEKQEVAPVQENILEEQQVEGQMNIDDEEFKEYAPTLKNIQLRAVPGDKLYIKFISTIEEVEVEKVTIEKARVLVHVRATDPNMIMYKEVDQEAWMTELFPTKKAAEQQAAEQQKGH